MSKIWTPANRSITYGMGAVTVASAAFAGYAAVTHETPPPPAPIEAREYNPADVTFTVGTSINTVLTPFGAGFSISPALPPSMILNSEGHLVGTTSTAGSTEYTLTFSTDEAKYTGTFNIVATALPAPTVRYASRFAIQTGSSSTIEGTVTGDNLTWSMSGTLPSGMTHADGVISGTPTDVGNFEVTLTATNAGGSATSDAIMIAVENVPASYSYPSGTHTLHVTRLMTPISPDSPEANHFVDISPALPAGLSIGVTGIVSGTPTVTGSNTHTLTDQAGNVATLTLNVITPTFMDRFVEKANAGERLSIGANLVEYGVCAGHPDSFGAMADAGLEYLEVPIHQTLDGEFIVGFDDLTAWTDGAGTITESSAAAVQAANITRGLRGTTWGAGTPRTLKQAYDLISGKTMSFIIRPAPGLASAIGTYLTANSIPANRIGVISDNAADLATWPDGTVTFYDHPNTDAAANVASYHTSENTWDECSKWQGSLLPYGIRDLNYVASLPPYADGHDILDLVFVDNKFSIGKSPLAMDRRGEAAQDAWLDPRTGAWTDLTLNPPGTRTWNGTTFSVDFAPTVPAVTGMVNHSYNVGDPAGVTYRTYIEGTLDFSNGDTDTRYSISILLGNDRFLDANSPRIGFDMRVLTSSFMRMSMFVGLGDTHETNVKELSPNFAHSSITLHWKFYQSTSDGLWTGEVNDAAFTAGTGKHRCTFDFDSDQYINHNTGSDSTTTMNKNNDFDFTIFGDVPESYPRYVAFGTESEGGQATLSWTP